MADIPLKTINGVGGLPRINSAVSKNLRVSTAARLSGNESFANLASGQALTTVVDITAKSAINYLFFDTDGTTTTIDQIKITMNGNVWIDDSAIAINSNGSLFAIGFMPISVAVSNITGLIVTDRYEVDTLKIEIDTTGATAAVHVRANVELTE